MEKYKLKFKMSCYKLSGISKILKIATKNQIMQLLNTPFQGFFLMQDKVNLYEGNREIGSELRYRFTEWKILAEKNSHTFRQKLETNEQYSLPSRQ